MQFKGQLLLPGESGAGLDVNLDVAEHHLAVESDGGGLGAWPLEVVEVKRLNGAEFCLTVAGEPLRFVADDTIAFAYSGVPAIDGVSRKSRKSSGFRSMLDRIWNGPDRSDQPVMVDDLSGEEQPGPEPIYEEQPDRVSSGSNLMRDDFPNAFESPIKENLGEEKPSEIASNRAQEPPVGVDAVQATETCPAVKSDGRRCESHILTSSGYCYPHDPRRDFEDGYQLALEVRARIKRHATERLNRIYDKLDKALRRVERGDLDPQTAMAMAQLARTMCAIVEMDEPTRPEDL